MKLLKLITLLLAATLGGAALADDLRVKTRLDAAGLTYHVDADGDYQLVYEFDDERSHMVIVNSRTHEVQGLEMRDVWAIAMRADSIAPEVAMEMLRRNSDYVIGAWNISTVGERQELVFCVALRALAPAAELAKVAAIVAEITDELEKELLGSDEF